MMNFYRIWVYHTIHHLYIVGRSSNKKYGVLRFTREDGSALEVSEHSTLYDASQIIQLLRQLHAVNQMHGGLVFVTKVGWQEGGRGSVKS